MTATYPEMKQCWRCGSDVRLHKSAVAEIRCENNYCAAASPHFPLDDVEGLIRWWNTRKEAK